MFTISNVLPHKPTSQEDFLAGYGEGASEGARGGINGGDLLRQTQYREGVGWRIGGDRPQVPVTSSILEVASTVTGGVSREVWCTWLVFAACCVNPYLIRTLGFRAPLPSHFVHSGAGIPTNANSGKGQIFSAAVDGEKY